MQVQRKPEGTRKERNVDEIYIQNNQSYTSRIFVRMCRCAYQKYHIYMESQRM